MKLKESFQQLGLSEEHLRIFLILIEHGDQSVIEIAKRVKLPRTTLYGYIDTLEKKGLIIRSKIGDKSQWAAELPEKVLGLFDKETFRISQAKKFYEEALPSLLKKKGRNTKNPALTTYSGIEGVKNVLRDMLMYRNIKTESFWPIRTMVEVLGEEFFIEHNINRIRQNIWANALWPTMRAVDLKRYKFLGEGKEFKREIRIAPTGIDTLMGYWAYADKVAFLSSRDELFGFIVQSHELRVLLSTQFEFIWNQSKKLEVPREWTQEFLTLL